MRESVFIAQIMVVGENRKFPAALIVPAFQAVTDHLRHRGSLQRSNRELVADREVNALIESEIHRLNEHFGHYSQIKKFILLPEEWSLAGGELTPTLKLKRRELLRKYADEIESLYDEGRQNDDRLHLLADEHLPNVSNRT
jgi:long-chain acyl-CoA synthetase